MAHIVITAETGCDVPAAEAAELGVVLVPMHVTVGSRTIDDGRSPGRDARAVPPARRAPQDERLHPA